MWRMLLCVIIAVAGNAQNPRVCRIAGHVVRHTDRHAMRGAIVSIWLLQDPQKQASATTGEDGAFAFEGVPAGKYQLRVTSHGKSQLYQESEQYSTGVVTGPDQDSEHIEFPFVVEGSIHGSIVDDENEPVSGATLYLFREALMEGRHETRFAEQGAADLSGRFHFRRLAAGTYYLAVVARPWYAQNGQPGNAPGELDVSYPVTYYGDSTQAEGAVPVKLPEGERVQIQIHMRAMPAVHLKITELDLSKGGGVNIEHIGPGGFHISMPQVFMMNDEVSGIAPGTYRLTFFKMLPGKQEMRGVGTQVVNLTGDASIDAGTGTKTALSGRVITKDGKRESQAPTELQIGADGGPTFPSRLKEDGTFEMPDIAPGRYWLRVTQPEDAYMEKVDVRGATYSDGRLDVKEGADVELAVTVGFGLSEVDGIVKRDGKPLGGAMVLLVPQDDRLRNKPIGRDQSDSDGTFAIGRLAPGRYTLLAIDNGEGLAYAEAGALSPYLKAGKVVELPIKKDARVEVDAQE